MISSKVKAHVSLRIVPDQDLETIASTVREHLEERFRRMNSPNRLNVSECMRLLQQSIHCMIQVTIDHMADWWLGNLDDTWFHALEDAVRDEWAVEPLRIREGGVSTMLCYHSDRHTTFDCSLFPQFHTSRRNLLAMRFICPWDRAR